MTHSSLRDRQAKGLFFTWSAQGSTRGLQVVEADGARFKIDDGRWIWDLESQVYNVNAGHQHPHIKARMIEQINTLPACAPNAVLEIRATLGELLSAKTGLAKSFLTCGGSEAVENAIKIARLVTGRSKVLARRHSYHGASLAVLGVSGDPRRAPFERDLHEPYLIEDLFPHPPTAAGAPSAWLASFDALLEREGPDSVAAVLLEGFTGTNGMQEPPADFWPGVRARCDAHGIMLIDDEIFSGFGRTGRWFAAEHWGVRPDMMTVGKGLTSGYAPLAGVVVNERIASHFDDHKLWCGLTHYAHPVSCAAAVGSIEAIEADGLVPLAAQVGATLRSGLEDMAGRYPGIVRVLGRGMMLGVVLDRPAAGLVEQGWARDLYIPSRDDTVFICPPLCLGHDGAQEVLGRLEEAMEAAGLATVAGR